MNFGALSRGFGTCCLRFKNGVANIPAKLASGWLARLYREGVEPSGLLQKVSDHIPILLFWICPGAREVSFEPPSPFTSFDHLVGAREQLVWNLEAERLSGLEIDDQLELGWLHHWKIGGLRTLENPTDIDAYLAICVGKIASVAHQATGRGELPKLINCRHCMVSHQGDKLITSADEEWVRPYDERPSSWVNDTRNGAFEVMFSAGR